MYVFGLGRACGYRVPRQEGGIASQPKMPCGCGTAAVGGREAGQPGTMRRFLLGRFVMRSRTWKQGAGERGQRVGLANEGERAAPSLGFLGPRVSEDSRRFT